VINFCNMHTENEIKAAAALKRNIMVGIEDLAAGRYLTYDDAAVLELAKEVSLHGRARLNALGLKVAAKVHGKK
jgi:hypothetical protein